jgi:glutathione S-transferase
MMILHGGRVSPFVRRVELWLAVQERPVERRYVSVFDADFGGLLAQNPLGRVPVLQTADGASLFETFAIIDYLEETAPPERRLIPAAGPSRWQLLQAMSLAHGIAEKTVALIYERLHRPMDKQWPEWRNRIKTQIRSGLAALEEAVGTETSPLDGLGISAVCAYDLAASKFPALVKPALANLADLSERANALPAFAATHPDLSLRA